MIPRTTSVIRINNEVNLLNHSGFLFNFKILFIFKFSLSTKTPIPEAPKQENSFAWCPFLAIFGLVECTLRLIEKKNYFDQAKATTNLGCCFRNKKMVEEIQFLP